MLGRRSKITDVRQTRRMNNVNVTLYDVKVSNLKSNKCDQVILAPSGNSFHRLKYTKRKSDGCTGTGNKKVKCGMDSSTPLQYRSPAPVLHDSSRSSPILQPLETELTPTELVELGDLSEDQPL